MSLTTRSIEAGPSGWLRTWLTVGVLLLPTDYLMPTAEALREAGAKPSVVAFSLAAFASWLRRRRQARRLMPSEQQPLWILLLCAGGLAFCVNLVAGWSDFEHAKSPIIQFAAQIAILTLFAAVTVELTDVFRSEPAREFVIRLFLPVALIHLAFFFLQATGILSDDPGTFLGLFRIGDSVIGRPTGLTSEPSYFGVFAALFGFSLFSQQSRGWFARYAVPLVLVGAALAINAKTAVAVIGIQLLGMLWLMRNRISAAARLAILAVFLAAAAYYLTSLATFDLEDNLSSVMRMGSTLLAWKVAMGGYAWIGIGTGQFHFFYRSTFAPDFLFLSQEALNQMDPLAPGRASTYNLLVRLLVEGGVVSLFLFLLILFRALRHATLARSDHGRFAFLLTLGSVGFLLTQDTYFYPPLCLSLAMAFALAPSRVTAERFAQLSPLL